MSTLADKLSELINTKSSIYNKIVEMGVTMSADEPFRNYPDFIAMITQIEETTTDQDLLQMCDVIMLIGTEYYVNKTYTPAEIQEVKDLLDLIVDGGANNE